MHYAIYCGVLKNESIIFDGNVNISMKNSRQPSKTRCKTGYFGNQKEFTTLYSPHM